MNKKRIPIIFLIVGFLLAGFFLSIGVAADLFPDKVSIRHAKGFTVEYHDTYKLLSVFHPWKDAQVTFRYVLVSRGTPRPPGYKNSQYIEIPVRSIVTMSTTYLGQLQELGVLETLAGHSNFKLVNTKEVLKMIKESAIEEVGSGPGVNMELLMDLMPDVIMTYGTGSVYDTHPKLIEAGLPTVINAAYMESSPLGRAEWIKFLAAFYNKEAEVERIFTTVEKTYNALRTRAEQCTEKPTVLLNAPYNGNWWIPGGNSYLAIFLRDAGSSYLWADDASNGSRIIDFEAVYERAADADFWLNPGQWEDLNDGMRADERLAEFRAFQEGNVYNNNARLNQYGGNDYWESGTTHPDVVLMDLLKIFHPELFPNHKLVYYQQLQ